LTWPAAYSEWILESTQNLTTGIWSPEAAATVSDGLSIVDVVEAIPGTFFRLRNP
jgi:hypothetical protein